MSAPAKKVAKPRQTPSHPAYKDMIVAAITALHEKNGASRQKIKKYVADNYKVSETSMKANFNKSLSKLMTTGALAHPKRGPGCYKLAEKPKEKKPAAAKKSPAAQKKAVKKPKATAAKKAVAKKPKAKKPAAKKATVKKSAKKPAPKKVTKKPAAKKTPKKSAAKKTVKKTAAKKK